MEVHVIILKHGVLCVMCVMTYESTATARKDVQSSNIAFNILYIFQSFLYIYSHIHSITHSHAHTHTHHTTTHIDCMTHFSSPSNSTILYIVYICYATTFSIRAFITIFITIHKYFLCSNYHIVYPRINSEAILALYFSFCIVYLPFISTENTHILSSCHRLDICIFEYIQFPFVY